MTLFSPITTKIVTCELRDVGRSRWLFAYAAFFFVVADALLRFGGADKALLSLTSVTLFIVPLVALVFGTVFLDDAREFTELLLAQPVARRQLYTGLYLGLTLPLAAAFVAGAAIPFAVHRIGNPTLDVSLGVLLAVGVTLTFVFTALAFVVAAFVDDRLRRMGTAIALWLVTAVLYDGLVLVLAMLLADYPIERTLLGLTLGNPVDLARVLLLLRFDVSALMGYTGAVFQQFFGGALGIAIASTALALWVTLPVALGLRAFRKRDF
ncbi:MAG TPA: ABC transporter permease subunit [Gemmatimonadaceae bacterium]